MSKAYHSRAAGQRLCTPAEKPGARFVAGFGQRYVRILQRGQGQGAGRWVARPE